MSEQESHKKAADRIVESGKDAIRYRAFRAAVMLGDERFFDVMEASAPDGDMATIEQFNAAMDLAIADAKNRGIKTK